ncbi:MAG: hypothetical protein ACOYIF_04030 [Acetivibrionales bacterium]
MNSSVSYVGVTKERMGQRKGWDKGKDGTKERMGQRKGWDKGTVLSAIK